MMSKKTRENILKIIIESGYFDVLNKNNQISALLDDFEGDGLMYIHGLLPEFSNNIKVTNARRQLRQEEWIDFLVNTLHVLDNDYIFEAFLSTIISPQYIESKEQIENLVNRINPMFPPGIRMTSYDEKNGIPQYIIDYSEVKEPHETTTSKYTFYVDRSPRMRDLDHHNHKSPQTFPAFVLIASDWDDYSVRSQFFMYYHEDHNHNQYIGSVKIIAHEQTPSDEHQAYSKSVEWLPESFTSLVDVACSLGQSNNYYLNLRNKFPETYQSILWSLQDCGFYSKIHEEYEHHRCFHSLIRSNDAERLLRTARYVVNDRAWEELFAFTYTFLPKYSDEHIDVKLDFNPRKNFATHRIYAIIGENGTGKTQLLSQLPVDYAAKNEDVFSPHIPIFSKIITVSNSYYDYYGRPLNPASINYVYCGLNHKELSEGDIDPIQMLVNRFRCAIEKIESQNSTFHNQKLFNILCNFLSEDRLLSVFTPECDIRNDNIEDFVRQMSSGESNLFFTICDIVANIRYDSLLLLDEPEVHLHPNAITLFMNTLYSLLEEYESYAIIATHSPIIIREMLGSQVYVLSRSEQDIPLIRKIGIESFAANISDLYEDIFSNRDVEQYFLKSIREMVKEGRNYEEIMKIFKSPYLASNLNLRLLVKNLLSPNEKD